MKIVRVDLTKSFKDIFKIEEDLGLVKGSLEYYKNESFTDIWIFEKNDSFENKDTGEKSPSILAAIHVDDRNKLIYSFDSFLMNIKPIEPKKEIIEYDIDKILEKINHLGIEFLTKSEKEFMINYSKKI